MIPYGKQTIDDDDIEAVAATLKSDWLTQGPKVDEFEKALANYCGAQFAVVMANGTAALHAAYAAAGVGSGDEVITSPMTFCATANAALYLGAKPVFVDIDDKTGNIDPSLIASKITSKTKVIAPIDYTGRPAQLHAIREIAKKNNLVVVEDACQALGASLDGKKIGAISDMTVFSFHPVKSITTGEGGAVLTNNESYYTFLKKFVTHGISKTDFVHPTQGPWYLEMQVLGNNYRLTDMQCALGISQLKKLDTFIEKRVALVHDYQRLLSGITDVILPEGDGSGIKSAWHLYVIRLKEHMVRKRRQIVEALREEGILVQIHHVPAYFHPYYENVGFSRGICPKAEFWYESVISLPLYPRLSFSEQEYVVKKFTKILGDLG